MNLSAVTETIIQFKNVTATAGERKILSNLSFTIQTSQIVAFLGPNGAGKTTTFEIITGLRSFKQGWVQVFQQKPLSWYAKNAIGWTSQEISFPGHLKTREILTWMGSQYQDAYKKEDLRDQLSLENIWNAKSGSLSGGEKRRLAIAVALIGKPKLLLLDEPTLGLDLYGKKQLWTILQDFKKNGGSVFLSTHDLQEVSEIADQVIFIDQGRKVFDGPRQELLNKANYKKISYVHKGERKTIFETNTDQWLKETYLNNSSFSDVEIIPASLEEALIKMKTQNDEVKT